MTLTLDAQSEDLYNYLKAISDKRDMLSKLPAFQKSVWDTHDKLIDALLDGSDPASLKTVIRDTLSSAEIANPTTGADAAKS